MSSTPEDEAAAAQAAAEGITVADGKIEFLGRSFRAAEGKFSAMRMLIFAKKASSGDDGEQLKGMATIYDMLRDAVDPADWDAFEQHAIDAGASLDDLMTVMMTATEAATSRPTTPLSGS